MSISCNNEVEEAMKYILFGAGPYLREHIDKKILNILNTL